MPDSHVRAMPPDRRRRTLLLGLAASAALPVTAAPVGHCAAPPWPLWQRFCDQFLQADGRVVDHSVTELHSTSESQSYAMFFALVANDPARFEQIWQWSIANLAAGDATARLPAWRWGRLGDGSWGVLDANSASDADLWFAYALIEAARAWRVPRYRTAAEALLGRVASEEVATLPGLGPALLPGPKGFVRNDGHLWRLNPSYLPLPLLRRFTEAQPGGPWRALAEGLPRLLDAAAPRGFVPDWLAYSADAATSGGAFAADPDKADTGSYDAIRTYLWAGMTAPADPLAGRILQRLGGMAGAIGTDGAPPEFVQAATGATRGSGPVGFSAALLPYFSARREAALLAGQQARVDAQLLDAAAGAARPYYDHVLGLFGAGWNEQRYRFRPSGALELRWEKACLRATKK